MYSILIIEDDTLYRNSMEIILQMEGFDVSTACDGRAGIAKALEIHPDLILCDILMPDIDGHMVLEKLKREQELTDTPFIFVTAMGDRADVRRGMSQGADDYLPKPFSAEELLTAVTVRIHRKELIKLHHKNSAYHKEQTILRTKITKREQEVLLMVGQGATSKEIAGHLNVCLKTVEVHRANLMKKLSAGNAAILTRWAVIAEQMKSNSA